MTQSNASAWLVPSAGSQWRHRLPALAEQHRRGRLAGFDSEDRLLQVGNNDSFITF